MPDPKSSVLKRWFEEVWNQGREEVIDELAAPDVVAHDLVDARGRRISGREVFHSFWHEFRATFPDIQIEVDDVLIDGEKELVRCTARGTHTGAAMGMTATHKPVQFKGMVMARIRDGQLVEVWENWDFLGMYQQLGAAPAPMV
jgi:steroid delta-isomerase-like uncharacterized protein